MADLTGAPVKTLKNDQGSISRNLRTIASALVNGAMILCVSEDESSIHLVTSLGDTKTTRAGGGAKKVNSLRLRRIMPQLSQVEEQGETLNQLKLSNQELVFIKHILPRFSSFQNRNCLPKSLVNNFRCQRYAIFVRVAKTLLHAN